MANRRMFSKDVVGSSKFLRLPVSARELYFQIGIYADDDGYCEWYPVLQITSAKEQDLSLLHGSGFIFIFDKDVLIIKDWKRNNLIRPDRYTPSVYLNKYENMLGIEPIEVTTNGMTLGCESAPQDRIGKDRLGKDIGEYEGSIADKSAHGDKSPVSIKVNNWKTEYGEDYIEGFNRLFHSKAILTPKRKEKLKKRFETFNAEQISRALINLSKSPFHQGDNDRGWKADPDFLIRSDEMVDKWLNYAEVR